MESSLRRMYGSYKHLLFSFNLPRILPILGALYRLMLIGKEDKPAN
jgi:hypothetical protein